MGKIGLIIRGHIRTGFDNNKLYNFVKKITTLYDIDLYIHTWNKIQNSLSWRSLNDINILVTEQTIIDYFKEISIKKIIIEDDSNINLIGNLEGKIAKSKMPIHGWKNMWHGKATIINSITNVSYVINTRFDYFNLNSAVIIDENILLKTINENENKIRFAIDGPYAGVDNFYCGPLDDIRTLTNNFNQNLDSILIKYSNELHQEKIVFFEVNRYTIKNSRVGFKGNTVFNPDPLRLNTSDVSQQMSIKNTNRYISSRFRLK